METPSPDLFASFLAVSRRPDIAAAICLAAVDGSWFGQAPVNAICSAAHLPLSRRSEATAVLEAGAAHGLFERHSPLTWSVRADLRTIQQLSWMLAGASAYANHVHQDADEVSVVLTKPAKPNELERALREAGYEEIGLFATSEMFAAMASGSRTVYTVMTPFLDVPGARMLMSLFNKTGAHVERRLIVRSTSAGLPEAYLAVADELRASGVRVYDYRLDREGGGFETFHAKVVLADRSRAYVGSTNMNQWSIGYSMELGVALSGRAATRIARVVDAVVTIAKLVH